MRSRFFVTAPPYVTEQKIINALQGCPDCSFRSARSVYGLIALVEMNEVHADRLGSLADEPKISVIPAESRAGREVQTLFDALNRKSA
jgi:hypothetical protein